MFYWSIKEKQRRKNCFWHYNTDKARVQINWKMISFASQTARTVNKVSAVIKVGKCKDCCQQKWEDSFFHKGKPWMEGGTVLIKVANGCHCPPQAPPLTLHFSPFPLLLMFKAFLFISGPFQMMTVVTVLTRSPIPKPYWSYLYSTCEHSPHTPDPYQLIYTITGFTASKLLTPTNIHHNGVYDTFDGLLLHELVRARLWTLHTKGRTNPTWWVAPNPTQASSVRIARVSSLQFIARPSPWGETVLFLSPTFWIFFCRMESGK